MRIRTIKPEFFTHELLFEAESETRLPLRLAFIGLWCCADREGRFKWEPRRLGVNVLPYDDVDFSDILDALESYNFIIRYGDGKYGYIPSFKTHQCINLREAQSNIPPYNDERTETHVHAREPEYKYTGINIQPKLRQFILLRDGFKCQRCGSTENLEVDHIFPRSIGGTHAKQNLRTLCKSCNSARPVQGEALLQDLARDGLTLDDMERTCTHVQARVEGKGKERKGKDLLSATADESEVESIFQAYPSQRRGGRKEAYKAIHAASKTTTLQALLSAVIAYANSAEVREKLAKGEQQFIPLLPTWLNKGRYETVDAQQPYDEFAYHPDYKPPQIGPHTVMVPLTDQDI